MQEHVTATVANVVPYVLGLGLGATFTAIVLAIVTRLVRQATQEAVRDAYETGQQNGYDTAVAELLNEALNSVHANGNNPGECSKCGGFLREIMRSRATMPLPWPADDDITAALVCLQCEHVEGWVA